MALAFAGVCLLQLVLTLALLGLQPGRGSYALVIVQLGLVLAFAGLAVYANGQRRQALREQRRRLGGSGRHA